MKTLLILSLLLPMLTSADDFDQICQSFKDHAKTNGTKSVSEDDMGKIMEKINPYDLTQAGNQLMIDFASADPDQKYDYFLKNLAPVKDKKWDCPEMQQILATYHKQNPPGRSLSPEEMKDLEKVPVAGEKTKFIYKKKK